MRKIPQCSLPFCYCSLSAQKHLPEHLFIPGMMPVPERFFADGTNRRSLYLAVAINLIGGMFVKEISGTQYPGYQPEREYIKEDGEEVYSRMGGEEYLDFLQAAIKSFSKQSGFKAQRSSVLLVHDKSRVHTSAKVSKGLFALNLRSRVQPPRSPDLQPLDYGFFGTVKAQLDRKLSRQAEWGLRVKTFKDIINQTDFRASIMQFPARLKACIEADGKHFNVALAAGKHKAQKV
jgi:hypothetical protein